MSRLDRLRALEEKLGPPQFVLVALERPDRERDEAIQASPRDTVLIVYTGIPDAHCSVSGLNS